MSFVVFSSLGLFGLVVMLHEFKCDRLSLYKGDPIGGINAYTMNGML